MKPQDNTAPHKTNSADGDQRIQFLRARLGHSEAREAFDVLIDYCEASSQSYSFDAKATKPAVNIVHTQREEDIPFAFIVNKSDLLFYIRKPAREELKVHVDHVARLFDRAEVSENPSQEITIRLTDASDAEKVITEILERFPNSSGRQVAAPLFSRQNIEAAMDAFDRYSKDGQDGEIFRHFGDPRDYWVRSSRDRENRVYPSKPLVGYLLKKTELNGGWGQKADAAARLHNSGFIIVDQADEPVQAPERYEHLISGADRIRLCALNYFIEPAQEKRLKTVTIRAGDLASAMGLKNAFPNICQTLGGEKLQQLAKVPAPAISEPNPSSSTTFTYQLGSKSEADTMEQASTTISASATNLILYGPPGTGKTFTTAAEAVRLCGEPVPQVRAELMTIYQQLVAAGRIEFVTFHQSMSYEEFVEGLRPETPGTEGQEPDADEVDTAGFRLKVEDGVFKRICERARLDPGKNSGDRRLDRTRPVFKVALG